MTIADWAICAVVLLNVIGAAMQGFFSEALTIAGLVVGYIVAVWKYRTLAEWFESFLKNPWLAEILGFLIIFFCHRDTVRHCRPGRPMGNEKVWTQRF